MINELIEIPLSKLRKLELPQLAKQVLEIVEKHEYETFKIKEAFDALDKLKPQWVNLEVRYGAHPLTKKITLLRQERNQYASSVISQLKAKKTANIASLREFVEIAEVPIDRFLKEMYQTSDVMINERLDAFFLLLANDEDLQDALETLDLTSYIVLMKVANSNLNEQWGKRNVSIKSRPKTKNPPIVLSTNAALRNLFSQINLAQFQNPGLNLMPMIDELNGLLARFLMMINIRASVNKKKAEKKLLEKEMNETAGFASTTLEVMNGITPMKIANVDMDVENQADLDEEKTDKHVANNNVKLPGQNGKASSF